MKFFLLSLLFFNHCMIYLSHLGSEQISHIFKREKIQDVLESNGFNTDIRDRLKFIQEVKNFGVENLALSPDSGFVYYVELNRDEVGWNVSASSPLKFESYTWWFPIAGEVPYKGFFNYEKAIEEENNLKKKGLDTRVRITGGYSTLGWFSDPIFSPQLKWEKPKLAGMVIHEMAHATVYIPGDTRFNESYANFVEKKGIEKFYQNSQNSEYPEELKNRDLRKKSLDLIKKTAFRLETIYNSNLSDAEKLERKREKIQEFKDIALKEKLVSSKNKQKFLEKDWNNEDFIGVLRYKSGSKYFERIFEESDQNFERFHSKVMDYAKLTDQEKKQAMEE